MKLSETGLKVLRDGEFDDLGLLGTTGLGYLKDAKHASKVRGPVITTAQIVAKSAPFVAGVILADDPETVFWDLHHSLGYEGFFGRHRGYESRGWESDGQNTIDLTAVIGKDGFEHHNGGPITHFGWVSLGSGITIGAHTAIDRSLWKEPTRIGNDTHIDNLVHVAHNVRIGDRCRVVAGTVIGGSVVVGDDVFIGIGVRIRPGVTIGERAFIGMSVTVLDDVPAGTRVTCRSS